MLKEGRERGQGNDFAKKHVAKCHLEERVNVSVKRARKNMYPLLRIWIHVFLL